MAECFCPIYHRFQYNDDNSDDDDDDDDDDNDDDNDDAFAPFTKGSNFVVVEIVGQIYHRFQKRHLEIFAHIHRFINFFH